MNNNFRHRNLEKIEEKQNPIFRLIKLAIWITILA
jgi:hypothetical protein